MTAPGVAGLAGAVQGKLGELAGSFFAQATVRSLSGISANVITPGASTELTVPLLRSCPALAVGDVVWLAGPPGSWVCLGPIGAAGGTAGQVASAPAAAIANSASTPSTFDHTFTTPVAGKIAIRQNVQFAPLIGQGTANRAQPSPVLAGIELVRTSDGAVLASDRDWSENYVLDNGYGLYGLANTNTELLYETVAPAGTYAARAVVWSVLNSGAPRASVQRLKTKWSLI